MYFISFLGVFLFLLVLSFFGFTQFRGVVVALVISTVYIVLKEACLFLDYSSLAFNCLRVILECFRDFVFTSISVLKRKEFWVSETFEEVILANLSKLFLQFLI